LALTTPKAKLEARKARAVAFTYVQIQNLIQILSQSPIELWMVANTHAGEPGSRPGFLRNSIGLGY
jgi:hypothetical protein